MLVNACDMFWVKDGLVVEHWPMTDLRCIETLQAKGMVDVSEPQSAKYVSECFRC